MRIQEADDLKLEIHLWNALVALQNARVFSGTRKFTDMVLEDAIESIKESYELVAKQNDQRTEYGD